MSASCRGVATWIVVFSSRQPEATALYRSAGYCAISPFGNYKPDPLSLFMEKRLR